MSYNNYTKRNHGDPLLYLDFHHHIILVRCNESSVLEKLQHEFHFFIKKAPAKSSFVIELIANKGPEIPPMPARKILEHAIIYRLENLKYVDYFGEALIIQDDILQSLKVYSENTGRLFELAFLSLHSILGEKLDQAGLHRVHAVGISLAQKNALIMLPSKGGKSTLLTSLLENPEVKIISDDMPLVDRRGAVHPFPSKISLNAKPESGLLAKLDWHEFRRAYYSPKWTTSLAQIYERIDMQPQSNRTKLIAGFRLSQGESLLSEVPKWKMVVPLCEHMIVGIGLPQVIEIFLSFALIDFIRLPFYAFKRTTAALALLLKSDCYYLYLGPDKSYNAQLILDLLYDDKNT
jgi:hypothetical protein